MTAILMGAASAFAPGSTPDNDFTITVGSATLYTTSKAPNPTGIGYDGGPDYWTVPSFGSTNLPSNQFDDGVGTTRTLNTLFWSGFSIDLIYFTLNGSGVPDSDDTFARLVTNVGGGPAPSEDGEQTWPRSGRLNYTSNVPAGWTHWTFGPQNNRPWPIPVSSVVPTRLEF